MRFSCSRDDLISALNMVKHGVSDRSTMQILEGILFNVYDNTLHLTGSDLNLGITTEIPVQDSEDGAIVLNANLIIGIISKMPGNVVYFSENDRNQVKVESLNSEFFINGLPAQDYPEFPVANETNTFEIESKILKNCFNQTKFAMAQEGSIPVITGLKLEAEDDKLAFVAIDGFRLALRNSTLVDSVEEAMEVVIPGKAVVHLSQLLPNNSDMVDVKLSDSQIFFQINETIFTTRLIEGKFIEYKDIFPNSPTTDFIISRSDLLGCCERAELVTNKNNNNLIKMEIDSGKLVISSNSDRGNLEDVIEIENHGNDLTIAFNSKYFIEALRAINDKDIKIEMTSSVGPAEIKPIKGNDYSYLILPVRLAQNS